MKSFVLIVAGSLALGLGIAGIFLPVLPTTPFLLLAAACYLRSSEKLYRWLTCHSLFGQHIRAYLKYRAVSVQSKIISIIGLWLSISASVIFFVPSWWLKGLLVLIAIAVSTHLLCLKTLSREMKEELKKESREINTE